MSNDPLSFAVIGGDLRQVYLANLLQESSYKVNTCRLPSKYLNTNINQTDSIQDAILGSRVIIGPIPCSKNNSDLFTTDNKENISLKEFFSYINKNQIFISGLLNKEINSIMLSQDISGIDILKNEGLAIAKAITTPFFCVI